MITRLLALGVSIGVLAVVPAKSWGANEDDDAPRKPRREQNQDARRPEHRSSEDNERPRARGQNDRDEASNGGSRGGFRPGGFGGFGPGRFGPGGPSRGRGTS